MEPQFNVVFTGEIAEGTDREAFIQAFSQRFKCDATRAAEVHDAGKPITLKTGLAQPTADQFKKALEALGMTIRLDPIAATTTDTLTSATEQPVTDEAANPYQAPSAELEQSPEYGEMTGPVTVPAGSGMSWITSGYSNHFKGNAGAWIGAVVVLFIISVIPFLNMITSLIMPVFVGGLMLGARAQDEGEDFRFSHLFLGFKQNTGQLILFSVLFIVSIIVLVVVGSLIMGGSMMLIGGMGEMGGTPPDPMAMLLPMLVMMLFFFPLMMAYWFAPALITIDNLSAITAMKLSFIGCLKNVLPFLIYGIVLMVLMFVAMIPLGLGLLVLMPVMYASMYTAYRDIYYPEA